MHPRMFGGSRPLTYSEAAGPEASLILRDPSLFENTTSLQPARPFRKATRKKMFSSWLNGLLIFLPIGFWAFWSDKAPLLIFATNAIAVVPLSSLLTSATEMIAADAGDTIGALLNITMGNLVELILFIALKHNQLHVVQASILGSVLVNLLPTLGTALCVCGISQCESTLNFAETQLLGCLLFVSVFVLLVPAAFNYTLKVQEGANEAMLKMSRASAFVVLLIYAFYLAHGLRQQHSSTAKVPETIELEDGYATLSSHPNRSPEADMVVREGNGQGHDYTETSIELNNIESLSTSSASLDGNSEEERGRKEHRLHDGNSRESSFGSSRSQSRQSCCDSIGSSTPYRPIRGWAKTGSKWLRIFWSSPSNVAKSQERVGKRSLGEKAISILTLTISSALMSMCTEFLVGTINAITHQGHLSESVIGLIILPVIGNVAEYVTVVTMASREKLDLAIAVAAGSAIQIALCAAPLTILAGWIMSRDVSFDFSLFEAAALLGAVALSTRLLLSDRDGNLEMPGIKGTLMCACYALIGYA
ncbi:vacuolar calcium ion transporter [Colletotrichum orchidophilum]|uniref:Vacuolar calcium ion transporter n=1 Tax=Colletotrichum orchidophilum TaxID=1209926 RepID=A0A1G4AMX8_9PEZI|nr:vacuolar calcium ion transporter [Colletotrichum orchidophilum]OHE90435.1 vacuolar calcium ion transporter [Colletotrichum orchidophilum]